MGFDGLPVIVLHDIGVRPLEGPGCSAGERRGVPAGLHSVSAGLVADQPHTRIIKECMEDADRVGPPADTRCHGIRQPAGPGQHLCASLHTDHPLEIAHHHRERVRPGGGAEAVVGVIGVGHPISEGLIDGILEGL